MNKKFKFGLGLGLCVTLLGTSLFATTGTNVPNITYSVSISSPTDGETYEKDSGQTGSASAEKDDDGTITDITGDISWSGDVSGSGGTSSDFTTSLGSTSLTASAETASDSVSVNIVEFELLEAEDTNTDAGGTRKDSSALKMVYSDSNRTADITFTYVSGGTPGSGYPKWQTSGSEVTATDGQTDISFSGGVGTHSATAEYASGATEGIFIDVIDDFDLNKSWDLDEAKLQAIKDKINSALATISGGSGPSLDLSGSVSVEFKVVDKYNDGTSVGLFALANGTVTADFLDVNFSSPDIVLGNTGCKMKISASVSASSVSLSADADYDDRQSSPGTVAGTVSGTTTVAAGATVATLGDVLSVTLTGSTTLNAGGGISYAAKTVTLSGSVTSTDLVADYSVNCDLSFLGEYELYSDSHTFTGTGVNLPYSSTLYDFN